MMTFLFFELCLLIWLFCLQAKWVKLWLYDWKEKSTLAVWVPASTGPPAVLALGSYCGDFLTEHRTQDWNDNVPVFTPDDHTHRCFKGSERTKNSLWKLLTIRQLLGSCYYLRTLTLCDLSDRVINPASEVSAEAVHCQTSFPETHFKQPEAIGRTSLRACGTEARTRRRRCSNVLDDLIKFKHEPHRMLNLCSIWCTSRVHVPNTRSHRPGQTSDSKAPSQSWCFLLHSPTLWRRGAEASTGCSLRWRSGIATPPWTFLAYFRVDLC